MIASVTSSTCNRTVRLRLVTRERLPHLSGRRVRPIRASGHPSVLARAHVASRLRHPLRIESRVTGAGSDGGGGGGGTAAVVGTAVGVQAGRHPEVQSRARGRAAWHDGGGGGGGGGSGGSGGRHGVRLVVRVVRRLHRRQHTHPPLLRPQVFPLVDPAGVLLDVRRDTPTRRKSANQRAAGCRQVTPILHGPPARPHTANGGWVERYDCHRPPYWM